MNRKELLSWPKSEPKYTQRWHSASFLMLIFPLLLSSFYASAQNNQPTRPGLDYAGAFGILAGGQIDANCEVYAYGMVGATSTIASGINGSGGVFPQNSGTVSNAIGSLTDAIKECLDYEMEGIGSNLSGQTLEEGVYWIAGDAELGNGTPLTLKGNSSSVFIFNIENSFFIEPHASIILEEGIRPENIFWNIAENFEVNEYASVQGVFMAGGNIAVSGVQSGVKSLLALGDVTFNDLDILIGTSSFYSSDYLDNMRIVPNCISTPVPGNLILNGHLDDVSSLLINSSITDLADLPTISQPLCHWGGIGSTNAYNVSSWPNAYGSQNPPNRPVYGLDHASRNGDGMAGIVYVPVNAGGTGTELIGQPLQNNLVAGRQYYTEFYVRLSVNSQFSLNNMGIYFATDPRPSNRDLQDGITEPNPSLVNSPLGTQFSTLMVTPELAAALQRRAGKIWH